MKKNKSKRLVVLTVVAVLFISATIFMLADKDAVETGTTTTAEATEKLTTEKQTTEKQTTEKQTTTEKVTQQETKPPKAINEIAEEVISGVWGSGDARRTKLEKAGYDYDEVQAEVNRIEAQRKTTSGTEKAPQTATNNTVATTEEPFGENWIGSPGGNDEDEETTKSDKKEDLSKLGSKVYGDTARAGLYYDDDGNRTTYNKIPEGEWYYYYDSYGERHYDQKPYSKGNEPTVYYDYCHMCGHKLKGTDYYGADKCPSCKKKIGYGANWGNYCTDCGKYAKDENDTSACEVGGCTQWIKTVTCSNCGVKVPAYTCHTCKK